MTGTHLKQIPARQMSLSNPSRQCPANVCRKSRGLGFPVRAGITPSLNSLRPREKLLLNQTPRELFQVVWLDSKLSRKSCAKSLPSARSSGTLVSSARRFCSAAIDDLHHRLYRSLRSASFNEFARVANFSGSACCLVFPLGIRKVAALPYQEFCNGLLHLVGLAGSV